MIEKLLYGFRKPKALNGLLSTYRWLSSTFNSDTIKSLFVPRENKKLAKNREKRVLEAVNPDKTPDMIPVIGNGINFFPAKYAGITCAEYMYDHRKFLESTMSVVRDFDLDMHFGSFLFAIGNMVETIGFDLLKIPGRDLNENSPYQFNEEIRLEASEYDAFLKHGIDYIVDPLAPQIAEMFGQSGFKRFKTEWKLASQALSFGKLIQKYYKKLEYNGGYTIFGTNAFPPFDILSFTFRTLSGIAQDLMKKERQEKMIELCERANPWLIKLWISLTKLTGSKGVWFPSERAFSLSPRQFEKYYWPTLKEMILALAKEDLTLFLTWEQDCTHLVHFLLELPKNIAKKCVFNCDTSDIFEVNRILDGHMAIAGNIPLSTMCVGTPTKVEKYCERLFSELKPDGNFLLSPALGIPDDARPENVHAMINYARKHGKY